MKAAIIFDNFGPYHWTRLAAAAKTVELSAVQVSATSAEYAWEHEARKVSFPVVTLFTGGQAQKVSVYAFHRRMAEVLDGLAPDVVFVPGWSGRAAFSALAWCLRHRVPSITMSESTRHDEDRKGWKEWIKSRLIRLHAAGLAGGNPHRDYLVKLGMPEAQIALGYDVVDNDYFAAEAAKIRAQEDHMRAQTQLPKQFFLTSARFIEKKNLARLLEAYAIYRGLWSQRAGGESNAQPWSLVLLGDGELRGALEAKRQELNLVPHVLLPGFKQYGDLPTYYALAGAFIHASTTEQWGLVVNEAMAAGLPVMVSQRCGCAADLVENGRNGFAFDPYKVPDLAELMYRLSTQTANDLARMGQESQRIISAWGPSRFAEGVKAAVRSAQSVTHHEVGLVGPLVLRALLYSS
jgi:glycosyltransferase involved in cell wall biosynthesis